MDAMKRLTRRLGRWADRSGAALGRLGEELTDSPWVGKVLRGAGRATQHNLEQMGALADGAADIVMGVALEDPDRAEQGVDALRQAGQDLAAGVARGVRHAGSRAATGAQCLLAGDTEGALEATKDLAALGLASVLAIGILDVVATDAEGVGDAAALADLADDAAAAAAVMGRPAEGG